MTQAVLVVAAALMNEEEKILIARRPPGKHMGDLWEFPGGKVEPGETPEGALIRELEEELGVEIDVEDLKAFTFCTYEYEEYPLVLLLYLCQRWRGDPQPIEAPEVAWVEASELARHPMPPADEPLVEMLASLLGE